MVWAVIGSRPGGGRIVEQQRRFGHHGARDRDAPPHAAGKFARIASPSSVPVPRSAAIRAPPAPSCRAASGWPSGSAADRPRSARPSWNRTARFPGTACRFCCGCRTARLSGIFVTSSSNRKTCPEAARNQAHRGLEQDGLAAAGRAQDDAGFALPHVERDIVEGRTSSSKPTLTFSKRRRLAFGSHGHVMTPVWLTKDLADEKIQNEDSDRRRDHRLCGGAAHTLCSALVRSP